MWQGVGILLRPAKRVVFVALSKLHRTTRPRVAVKCKNQLLLVQNWGDSTFALPGGGSHRGEDAMVAAIREIREEVGIVVTPDQLHFIDTISLKYYDAPLFLLELPEKPSIKRQKLEITTYMWCTRGDHPRIDSGTRELLATLPNGVFH